MLLFWKSDVGQAASHRECAAVVYNTGYQKTVSVCVHFNEVICARLRLGVCGCDPRRFEVTERETAGFCSLDRSQIISRRQCRCRAFHLSVRSTCFQGLPRYSWNAQRQSAWLAKTKNTPTHRGMLIKRGDISKLKVWVSEWMSRQQSIALMPLTDRQISIWLGFFSWALNFCFHRSVES